MNMTDKEIIENIIARDERALEQLSAAYGKLCRSIARNILHDPQDAEEALNDALFQAWYAVPKSPPAHLQAYLITLTRRIALDRCKAENRLKRGGGQVPAALSELENCLSASDDVEQITDRRALTEAVNRFLGTLSPKKRRIFIERYTFLMQADEIAERHGMSASAVNMQLSRIRTRLKQYLKGEDLL